MQLICFFFHCTSVKSISILICPVIVSSLVHGGFQTKVGHKYIVSSISCGYFLSCYVAKNGPSTYLIGVSVSMKIVFFFDSSFILRPSNNIAHNNCPILCRWEVLQFLIIKCMKNPVSCIVYYGTNPASNSHFVSYHIDWSIVRAKPQAFSNNVWWQSASFYYFFKWILWNKWLCNVACWSKDGYRKIILLLVMLMHLNEQSRLHVLCFWLNCFRLGFILLLPAGIYDDLSFFFLFLICILFLSFLLSHLSRGVGWGEGGCQFYIIGVWWVYHNIWNPVSRDSQRNDTRHILVILSNFLLEH